MKSKIETRLTRQLVGKHQQGAANMAHGLLVKNGIIEPSGALTSKGKARNHMSPSARAKDRASKESGKPTSDYVYDKKTNKATLKGGK